MVTIYSTTHCPFCKMAKDYLDKSGVSYKDINVEVDDDGLADMFKKSGQNGVPVIDIDGTIIVGFDREAIDRALKL